MRKPAQKELVSQYSGYLLTICRRYVRDQHYCQDVCQNAFIKIFRKLEQFDDTRGTLKSWMYRVTVNCALEFLRSQKRVEDIESMSEPAGKHVPAIENLIEEDLLKLLNELSEIQRTIFNLVEIEGYDHGSAAELLDIKVSTSRSHLFRARKVLSDRLTKQNRIQISSRQ